MPGFLLEVHTPEPHPGPPDLIELLPVLFWVCVGFVFFFFQFELLSVGLLQLCNFNTNSFYLERQLARAKMCP